MNLPIDPSSIITLSLPIPSLPGVPPGATTVPPLFSDVSLAQLPEETEEYPLLERYGLLSGLPFGYSYAPTRPIKVHSVKYENDKFVPAGIAATLEEPAKRAMWIPDGTVRVPPRYETMDTKSIPYRRLM